MAFIGIDLGTTNSLVANKKYKRETMVFSIKGETGVSLEEETRSYLPSAVSFKDGSYLIGWDVVNNPEQSERIFSIKRLMGRGYDDRDLQKGFFIRDKIRETWGYRIRKPHGGSGEDIEVKLGEDWLTPQEVSALILRRLKEIVKGELEGEDVDGAVITVPAYFNDKQRWATREAARLAGLNVQMILDEPTASAIAYGMETLGAEPRTVLVYDLGGGTFDISLLEIEGTNFRVSAVAGNNWLGGDDFDIEIINYVLDEIRDSGADIIKNDQIKKSILKQRAMEAKERLSTDLETTVRIGDLLPGKKDIPLTRKKFEKMINPYINETLALIDSVLGEKSKTEDNIDKILLVGGSTRIPLVRELLTEKFGKEKIASEINPMLCVAIGAAIKSSWLLDKWECPNHSCGKLNEERDVKCSSCGHPRPETTPSTERPYGLRSYDEEKQRFIFDVLIPEYTPYPLREPKKRIYGIQDTNARIMRFRFFAGEKSGNKFYHDEIEKNTHLGTIWIVLPKGLSISDNVIIDFNLDSNGILDLESISINVAGRPIERKAIIRTGEEENIANEIEELLNDIPKKVKNSDKREVLIDRAFKLFEELFEIGSISDKQLKEEKITELRKKIEELWWDIDGGDGPPPPPPEPSIITAAKNTIRYSYYVETEYNWLPFMKDESLREHIREVRADLEAKIAEYEKRKELTEENKWEIELLTMQLSNLLSNPGLNLLLEIEAASNIAKEGKQADIGPIIIDPKKLRDKYGSSEKIFETKTQSERIEDAKKLRNAKIEIEGLLKQGKIQEANEEYSKISNLVIYYLTEYAKE